MTSALEVAGCLVVVEDVAVLIAHFEDDHRVELARFRDANVTPLELDALG